jgi:hypothetical protein
MCVQVTYGQLPEPKRHKEYENGADEDSEGDRLGLEEVLGRLLLLDVKRHGMGNDLVETDRKDEDHAVET